MSTSRLKTIVKHLTIPLRSNTLLSPLLLCRNINNLLFLNQVIFGRPDTGAMPQTGITGYRELGLNLLIRELFGRRDIGDLAEDATASIMATGAGMLDSMVVSTMDSAMSVRDTRAAIGRVATSITIAL
jgi:hypothetical protein